MKVKVGKLFLNGSNAKRRRDMNRNRRKKLKNKFFTLSNAREERKARDGKVSVWSLDPLKINGRLRNQTSVVLDPMTGN